MKETHQAIVDGLREMATFIERYGDELSETYLPDIDVNALADNDDEAKAWLAAMARICGRADKIGNGDWYSLRKRFSSTVRIDFAARREHVCTRRQVGTRVVPATEEHIVPAQPEHEEPIYEWDCGSILDVAREPFEEEATS